MDTLEPERMEGGFERENVGRTRKESVRFASYKARPNARLVAILLMRLDLICPTVYGNDISQLVNY
jgi:hypothetical protein